jgi:hypothetical protein
VDVLSNANASRLIVQFAMLCVMAISVLASLIAAMLLMRTDRRRQKHL